MRRVSGAVLAAALLLGTACGHEESSGPAGAVKERVFSTPDAAIRAFCELDAQGRRLPLSPDGEESAVYRQLVHWKSEPDWDGAVIISGYRISAVKLNPGRANATVTYTVKGDYSPGRAAFYRSIETTAFTLIDTEGGWKVQGPAVRPHMYASALIEGLQSRISRSTDPRMRKKLWKDIHLLQNMNRFAISGDAANL